MYVFMLFFPGELQDTGAVPGFDGGEGEHALGVCSSAFLAFPFNLQFISSNFVRCTWYLVRLLRPVRRTRKAVYGKTVRTV